MSAIAFNDNAREWGTALEDRESARSGVAIHLARKAVARRLEVAPGALENIRRGRVKGVRAWLYERIRAGVIREIESEMARLSHELEVARRSGLAVNKGEAHAVEARIASLAKLIVEGEQ